MLASAAFRHLTLWGWLVVVLTTNQSPLYGAFSVNRCVRAYREKASAAYARTQQNTQILLYRGSYSPTVGSKVGLHEALSQYQRADGHFLKAAGHTGVEDQIGPDFSSSPSFFLTETSERS